MPKARYIRLWFSVRPLTWSGHPADSIFGSYIDAVRLTGDISYSDALPADQTLAPCECPFGCSTGHTNWVGGPINTRSGNYHYSQEDISIPTLGGPLRFERSYNAQAVELYTTPLGPGWTHNYDVDLTFENDPSGEEDMVIVKGCRGSRFRFEKKNDYVYEPYPGVWATLTRSEDGDLYYLQGVDQSTYVFDGEGRLIEVQDPQGHAVTLSYDDGLLQRVTDSSGKRYLGFEYDKDLLQAVYDHAERVVKCEYEKDRLASVLDLRSEAWRYKYNDDGLLREVFDPNGNVVERTEYEGDRAVQQWCGFRVGEQPDDEESLRIHYDENGTTTIIDPLGRVTKDWYDERGLLTWQGDAGGASYRAYDDNFNRTATSDENHNVTQHKFNPMGQPEEVTDALGNVTQMAYDDLGHLLAVTDALGNTTRYEYEGNLLVRVTDALNGTLVNSYDKLGLLSQTVDHGVTTDYKYEEKFGQLEGIIDALGVVTTFEYDVAGRLTATTEEIAPSLSRVTVNEYDKGDNLIRVTASSLPGYGQNYQDTYNIVTEYEYDPTGNLAAVTDTEGHVTRYWYDGANRLIRSVVNYNENYHDQGPGNDWNITTLYGYDEVGKQTHGTDTLGRVTQHWYDDLDRLVRSTVNYDEGYHDQGPENDRNVNTRYGYDGVGNLTHVTDTLGHVTRSWYDDANRLVAVTVNYGAETGADANLSTRYGYDALGRQTVIVDASGISTTMDYDELGRLHETRDGLGNVTRYGYDSRGNRETVTDGRGVVTRYEHDDRGQLTAVIEDSTFSSRWTAQANVRTEYAYDTLGNRTIITDAQEQATHYVYDSLGRLVAETDPLGHSTEYAYDALSRRTAVTDPSTGSGQAADGGVTSYVYDHLDRLTGIHYPAFGSQAAFSVLYSYDEMGRRDSMRDQSGEARYKYDYLDRLIGFASPVTDTLEYGYDALGNRTRMIYPSGETLDYVYDDAGRLVQVEDWDGGVTRYAYDRAGRPLTTTLPNGITTTYRYDRAGRLVNLAHTGTSGALAVYTYTLDQVGNRVAVEEHVKSPLWRIYLPLMVRNYGVGEGTILKGSFESPLPTPAPTPRSGRLPPSAPARAGLPDPTLLLFAPLAVLAAFQGQKKRRRTAMAARMLLAVIVVGLGVVLAGWIVSPVEAVPDPRPDSGRTIVYEYDPLNRLIEATYSSGEHYGYTYDAANRLTSVDGVAYTYDDRGNQTGNGTFTYEYDGAGRMVAIQGNGKALRYFYDGDGLRVMQSVNDNETVYAWDVAAGLPQVLSSGGTRYVPGVGQWDGEEWSYALPDGLGSTRQLVDADGRIVQRPFGKEVI